MKTDKPGREPANGADRWKLSRAQRRALAKWIGEGCTPREINKRASKLKEPFKITRQGIDYYREKLKVKVKELRSESDAEAAIEGFAVKTERIRVLDALANRILEDLKPENKGLWLEDKKMLGAGPMAEVYDFERFNLAQVNALREIHGDIAAEMGARNSKAIGLEVPTEQGNIKLYVGIDPDLV
jgi:hypothetical protein